MILIYLDGAKEDGHIERKSYEVEKGLIKRTAFQKMKCAKGFRQVMGWISAGGMARLY